MKLLIERRVIRDVEHERKRLNLGEALAEIKCAWHGVKLNQPDWSPLSHTIAIGGELKREGVSAHIILNAYWEPLDFELPILKGSGNWWRWIDTALDPPDDICEWDAEKPVPGTTYRVGARSVVVLIRQRTDRGPNAPEPAASIVQRVVKTLKYREELCLTTDLWRSAACGFCKSTRLPVPSVVFLMAAGALSARGEMRTSIIVSLGVLGCLAGDGIWFWIGRKWGSKAVRLLCRFTADPRGCSRNAQEKFRRYGLPVLCVAKFFPGLDAVMPPLAGAEGVSLARFLALDPVGSLLWSAAMPDWATSSRTNWMLPFVGFTFRDRPRYRDRGSHRSLCRLAGTGSGANDPSTTAAPHQSTDARTQTEIQQQGRSARPAELRRRKRHRKRGGYSGRFQGGSLPCCASLRISLFPMMSRSFSILLRAAIRLARGRPWA